jgi:hypothetical protein
MPRVSHGSVITFQQIDTALERINQFNAAIGQPPVAVIAPDWSRFDYLFPELQSNDGDRLPSGPGTVTALKALGEAMTAPPEQVFDSSIPSAYAYFGQFVDHDITFRVVTRDVPLDGNNLEPLSISEARLIKNARTAKFDLDSVYGYYVHGGQPELPPREGDKMVLGRMNQGPGGKDILRELPREKQSDVENDPLDRAAKIGDGRNDESLMVSQMHVAFLRVHNAIVDRGNNFDEASKILRQHYQWIVITDFLDRICDPGTLKVVRADPGRFYDPPADDFFLPHEFTVAAFRFGHSLVRSRYAVNKFLTHEPLGELFMRKTLNGYPTLPWGWRVSWAQFLDGGPNLSRRIDTRIVDPLRFLLDESGKPITVVPNLAARNLLRGYHLRMPTGQAVARFLNLPVMSEADIREVATDAQVEVLDGANLLERTPLWFYILAEAAKHGAGNHLGPVGTALVASVLIGLVRRSDNSILGEEKWVPVLGPEDGQFTLTDLLRLAGVLE